MYHTSHVMATFSATFLGYGKACLPAALDLVRTTLSDARATGGLEAARASCHARQTEYREGQAELQAFAGTASKGSRYLAAWDLAARNLVSRSDVTAFLLERVDEVIEQRSLRGTARDKALNLLANQRALRDETAAQYATMVGQSRGNLMIGYMFDAVERALAGLAGVVPADRVTARV